jgi:ferredoxin
VVCPTGIDIRNGTQLECINCTVCIDACDEIMDRIGYEKGLIKYASEDDIEKGEKFKFTKRIASYTVVLTVLVGLLISLLFIRNDVDATIVRLPGNTFYTEGDNIKNVYTFKLLNKTINNYDNIEIKLINHKGEIQIIGNTGVLKKQAFTEGTIFVIIPKKDLKSSKEKIKVGFYSNAELIETTNTNFQGPIK